jgi:ADP-ribosylglycohydrolase
MDIHDKLKGMFIAGMLGDALGLPHERGAAIPYTGKLEHSTNCNTSDDTEMALTLGTVVVNGYNRNNAVVAYIKWMQTKPKGAGKRTRDLFSGIKAINPANILKTFARREQKVNLKTTANRPPRSNGALMRCWPLAILPNYIEVAQVDCYITNPDPLAYEVELIYLTALRCILLGMSKEDIWITIAEIPTFPETIQVLEDVQMQVGRDINIRGWKGYCINTLYAALYGFFNFESYTQSMHYLIDILKGDTDTNACVCGALIGAYQGFNVLSGDPQTKANIDILLTSDSNRPIEYQASSYEPIVNQLSVLFG